jgi:CDP-diacylglycerol---serine O-phosphatidyltransferase
MVAEIPMFSLKFKTYDFKTNKIKYIFLFISIIILALFQLKAFPILIGLYIFMSVASNLLVSKAKNEKA